MKTITLRQMRKMSTTDLGRALNKARSYDDIKTMSKIQNYSLKNEIWDEVRQRSRVKSYYNMNEREQKAAMIGFETLYRDQIEIRELSHKKFKEKEILYMGEWYTRDKFVSNLDEFGLNWLDDLNSEELNRVRQKGLGDTWKEAITER